MCFSDRWGPDTIVDDSTDSTQGRGSRVNTQVGQVLRSRRETLGLPLEQVHAQLRIPLRWLQAIEEDRFDLFDSPQYAKGFVRAYAAYLGLDPEPLVRTVAARCGQGRAPHLVFPGGEVPIRPAVPPSRLRRLAAWAAFGAALAVVGFGYLGYRQLRAFFTTAEVPVQVTSPAPAASAPEPEGPQAPLGPALPPAAMAGEPAVRVVLAAEDVSWLRVVADGRRVFEGFIRTGERREWEAAKSLHVVIGNAGGVRVQVNGQDLGVLGAPGEVVRRTFGPPAR